MDFLSGYKSFARRHGFEFDNDEDYVKFTALPGNEINSKHCILIKEDTVFYASDSYAPKAGMNSSYSGIYLMTGRALGINGLMRKRVALIDFFSRRITAGDKEIDTRLSVYADNKAMALKLINRQIADSYLQLCKEVFPVKIILADSKTRDFPFIRTTGETCIGIEFDRWIYPDTLGQIYPMALQILRDFSKTISYF